MLPYRLLISLLALVELTRAARRGGRTALRARLGLGDTPPDAPHVWLHGASNGELASARPVLERLVAAEPGLHWLVTCNSQTGLALVQGWTLPRVSVRAAPLDLERVGVRMMRDWRVVAHVSLESELWPHRFLACPGPVFLLGARMSAGTARALARLPRLVARMLGRVTFASAQDTDSLERLAALGLPPAARGPVVDLKAFYAAPSLAPDEGLQAAFPRAATWLAASTHKGEEEVVLDAHADALRAGPGLRLILAPRHPRRGDAVEALIRARGFTLARRSRGEAPDGAQVYLADTMGEMALWYALAGRVFIGGTLTGRGGHTPYEPAAFGAALIHGPDMRNFAAAAHLLAGAGCAVIARDADTLAAALRDLAPPERQAATGAAQASALQPATALDPLVAEILRHLPAH